VARSPTELLAHHHDRLRCHNPRHKRLLHDRPIALPPRHTMVPPSPPSTPFPYNTKQKLTLHPRIFPYSIATASLTLVFIFIILALIQQRQLLPGIVFLISFILFVLYLAGLIETSIQLYGPTNSVNYYCNLYKPVSGGSEGGEPGQATLAYLETLGLCNDWKAVFAFYIVGAVFLLWMMVMSNQVNRDEFE
jgi:hypothetical protein